MRDDLIYDVGMHTGEDTEFYLRKGFRVVGTIDFFLNEQVSIWGTANLEWVKRNEAQGFKSHPV